MKSVIDHYDKLIDEGNDPVFDPGPLREYMNKWDGTAFIEKMRLDKSKTVLEIGVGTGRLAIEVAPRCKSFVGIDISPKAIARARENLPFSNTELICDDFLRYSFKRRYDVIYSSLTFMHIEDKFSALSKVASILTDNGRFVLSIDKNQSGFIDYGTRKIRIYPDSAVKITKTFLRTGLKIEESFETEFAHVFVVKKVCLN